MNNLEEYQPLLLSNGIEIRGNHQSQKRWKIAPLTLFGAITNLVVLIVVLALTLHSSKCIYMFFTLNPQIVQIFGPKICSNV